VAMSGLHVPDYSVEVDFGQTRPFHKSCQRGIAILQAFELLLNFNKGALHTRGRVHMEERAPSRATPKQQEQEQKAICDIPYALRSLTRAGRTQ
jgi:hypothetical protein